jgi:hypothetical protein
MVQTRFISHLTNIIATPFHVSFMNTFADLFLLLLQVHLDTIAKLHLSHKMSKL